jgi:hypothetical protein
MHAAMKAMECPHARYTGVFLKSGLVAVQAGFWDVAPNGDERFLSPLGKILQFKDSSILGYEVKADE